MNQGVVVDFESCQARLKTEFFLSRINSLQWFNGSKLFQWKLLVYNMGMIPFYIAKETPYKFVLPKAMNFWSNKRWS